jgi:hypothetical protein
MLDSANYNTGAVVIAKSVTVMAVPGALGSVLSIGSGNAAIQVTAGRVTLRNLHILAHASTPGSYGVRVSGGTHFTLDRSHVTGVPINAVLVEAAVQVAVVDSVVTGLNGNGTALFLSNNATARVVGSTFVNGSSGVVALPQADGHSASATVMRSVVANNSASGIAALAAGANTTARVYVIDSTIEGNNTGVSAATVGAGASAEATVSTSLITRNNIGVLANTASSSVLANGNTVVRNTTGMRKNGGTFTSMKNALAVNGADTVGTITPATPF